MKSTIKKIKYRLRLVAFNIKNLLEIPICKNKNGVLVINYHGIVKENPLKFNSRFISESEFKKHLTFFKENTNVISLDDFVNGNKIDNTKLNVVITFDDGYENNYKYAVPLLKEYKFPATFCVSTNEGLDVIWNDLLDICIKDSPNQKIFFDSQYWILGESKESLRKKLKSSNGKLIKELVNSLAPIFNPIKQKYSDYWKLMTNDQIKEIIENDLFKMVPHGNLHISLKEVNYDAAVLDIEKSIEKIEAITHKKTDAFCFPYGEYNEKLNLYLTKRGVNKLLIVDYFNENDTLNKQLISRFAINPHISFKNQIRFLSRGKYF